jgi:hypothetical protein
LLFQIQLVPLHLGDAGRAKGPVLLRAFEGLLAMGLVEARLGSGGGGAGGVGLNAGGGNFVGGGGGVVRGRGAGGGHKQFRMIQLLLTVGRCKSNSVADP